MEVLDAIKERRSIRIFKQEKVPSEIIQKILAITILAPSAHNKQPWRFVVVENDKKDELVQILEDVYKNMTMMGIKPGYLKRTIWCMKRAPFFILVFNSGGSYKVAEKKDEEVYKWIVDIQSIGAAVQTMLLAAHSEGVGTLWTGEVLFADEQICSWLNCKYELIGGVCLGYADETPNARPRLQWNEVTEWLK